MKLALAALVAFAAVPPIRAQAHPFAGEAAGVAAIWESARTLPVGAAAAAASRGPCIGRRDTISEDEVRRLLDAVAYLSSPYDRNMRIEECFNAATERLEWRSARLLFEGLNATALPDAAFGRNSAGNRMSERYLKTLGSRLDAQTAIEVAGFQSSGYGRNELLGGYHEANVARLDVADALALLKGLKATGLPDAGVGGHTTLRTRIADRHLAAHAMELGTGAVLALVDLVPWTYERNRLIERHFTWNIRALRWEDVQRLLAGVAATELPHAQFGSSSVRDRMIKAWTDCGR
ncbi:MAG: hypothetical protein HY554_13080 [Elusimicrobia bacterium]|nr:hypothetical protein [Elusimicrobiota bacterium]